MKYKLKMHDMPNENRPRERMIMYGAEVLSDIELLAILIRSGTKKEGVMGLSQRLLSEFGGLHSLFQTSITRLHKVPGLGPAKICILAACFELSKRLAAKQRVEKPVLSSPDEVANYFLPHLRYLKQEHLKTVYLDLKNRLLEHHTISIGTLDRSIVHPRDIFRHAIDLPCAAIILIHNHPTGDPTPSKEDVAVTKRIIKAGEIMGLPLLDHIIFGDGNYVSLKEKGLI